uniref:Uncharacterized protein n=1 Tax=viral metagenome TaxID=1070528 RepID=A0A6C0AED8_9ZZZZ
MYKNIIWYPFLNSDENYDKALLSREKPEKSTLIISTDVHDSRKYAKFNSIFDFIDFSTNHTKEDYKCFYETIPGNLPQKIYFDLDIYLEGSNKKDKKRYTIEEAKDAIYLLQDKIIELEPCVKSKDIFVFCSHGENKRSYHVVVDNWCLPDCINNKYFFKAIMKIFPEKYKDMLDPGVYSSMQQFRIYGNHKWKSDRKKILDPDCQWEPPIKCTSEKHRKFLVLLHSLITNCEGCKILKRYAPEKNNVYFREIFLKDPEIKESINMCAKILKCKDFLDDNFPFKISEIKGGLVLLKRLFPSFCNICQKIHHKQDSYLIINKSGVYLDCRRNPEGKKLFLGKIDIEESDIEDNSEENSDSSPESESEDNSEVLDESDIEINEDIEPEKKIATPEKKIEITHEMFNSKIESLISKSNILSKNVYKKKEKKNKKIKDDKIKIPFVEIDLNIKKVSDRKDKKFSGIKCLV